MRNYTVKQRQNEPPPTSAPDGMTWQVAVEQPPVIPSFSAPTPTLTQRMMLTYTQMHFRCVPVFFGTKLPYLSAAARVSPFYHDDQYPYQSHSAMEVFAGRCNIGILMGYPSGIPGDSKRRALYVLDCDTTAAFELVLKALKKRGIPIYGTKTKHGGHFYFYARREVENRGLDPILGVEIKGRNVIVIAPPSVFATPESVVIHRYTHIGEATEPPYVDPSEIDFLDYRDGTHLKIEFASTGRSKIHNGLTNLTNETIRIGHTFPDGKRQRIYTAARELWDKGYSRTEIENMLRLAASTSAKGYLEGVLNSVCKQTPKTPAKKKLMNAMERAEAYIQQHPFTGQSAATDRRVLKALAQRYLDGARDGVFRASYREIQDHAQTIGSLATVKKSLVRLMKRELVVYVGSDKVSGANCYRFGAWYKECTLGFSHTSEDSSVHLLYPTHSTDAAQRGAWNDTGMRIYDTLCSTLKPMPFNELVARSGLNPRTVKHHLNKNRWLQQSGFVKQVAGGWIAEYADDPTLDELVARPAGTLGKASARKKRNELDRARRVSKLFVVSRFKNKSDTLAEAGYTTMLQSIAIEYAAVLDEYAAYRKFAEYPTPKTRKGNVKKDSQ